MGQKQRSQVCFVEIREEHFEKMVFGRVKGGNRMHFSRGQSDGTSLGCLVVNKEEKSSGNWLGGDCRDPATWEESLQPQFSWGVVRRE